ncbi:cation:proton antiporter [Thiobacter aerophilum]|uniref:Cation:proton antiporter n=1 Tax=Thiobacter aerophilum TaxID=3121275 RepID=A0ABV0ED74_9BURK
MQDLFSFSLALLVAGAIAAAVASRLRLPTLLGYLAAGVALGPSVSGLLQPGASLTFLAEVGVVLLLFMVGLEFSVASLWATWRRVLSAGLMQMLFVGLAVGLASRALGVDARAAFLLGAAAAMSSSAIVGKQLAEQGELTVRHGRMAMAVLVFQDIATIPVLALLAIWARGGAPQTGAVLVEVAGVVVLFVVAVAASRRPLHRFMAWVARRGVEEVFLLVALTLVLGAAYGAHVLGVSPALGAFLAGIVLGESDFRHRMEDDIRPFRDVLLSLFFITVGLQVDAGQFLAAPLAVLAWFAALVPLKILLNWPALRLAGLSRADAWRSAVVLGHGGEFGLLLLSGAMTSGVIPAPQGQAALVALALSMGAAPLMIRHHERIARLLTRTAVHPAPPQEEDVGLRAAQLKQHVIVCGAGQLGRIVSQALAVAEIPHLVVESDYEAYQIARAEGLPVYYGDASRINTLRAAGVERARLVVITFHRSEQALRIVHYLRHTHPDVPVLATSLTDREARRLLGEPGVKVYVERLAAGLALAERALLESGVDAERTDGLIAALRETLQSPLHPAKETP